MAEVVQVDVRKAGGVEDFVVDGGHGVGVLHAEGDRGGEHIFNFRVLFVLFFENVYRFLGQ